MKKWIAALICVCMLCTCSAYAEESGAKYKNLEEAKNIVTDGQVLNAVHYVVSDDLTSVFVYLQSDEINDLLHNESFSQWSGVEKIVSNYYDYFMLAENLDGYAYAVWIILVDDAMMANVEEREILWVYGLNSSGEAATLYHIRDGLGGFPESLEYWKTMK